jgi:hypothetical protein
VIAPDPLVAKGGNEVSTAPPKQLLLPQKSPARRGFAGRAAARAPLKFDEKTQANIL